MEPLPILVAHLSELPELLNILGLLAGFVESRTRALAAGFRAFLNLGDGPVRGELNFTQKIFKLDFCVGGHFGRIPREVVLIANDFAAMNENIAHITAAARVD